MKENVNGKPQWTIPNELAQAGFIVPSSDATYRLIVSNAAHEKSGKSHFALTAPDPIGYIDTDIGSEGVVEKFLKTKRVAVMHCRATPGEVKLVKNVNIEDVKKRYETQWSKIAAAYNKLLESKLIRTIVLDTATETFETLKLARFGRLTKVMPYMYGPVNNEYRNFIRQIYSTNKNLILLHKVRKQYSATGKTDREGNPTEAWNGEWEMAGYADTKYLVQCNVQSFRAGENSDKEFGLRILDCRQNPDLAGTEMGESECGFPDLAAAVFENNVANWR